MSIQKLSSTPQENSNKNDALGLNRQRTQTHDFEFYITRYPFPHGSVALKNKFYKTQYECEGFQFTNQSLLQITNFNRLNSLIKLKQIVKNISKPGTSLSNSLDGVAIDSYSLFYQVVHHFILSASAISIIKSKNSKYMKLFQGVFQIVQTLISQKMYYLLDIQNIGVTLGGQVKLYVPPNIIIQECYFTVDHENKMRATANIVIDCIIRGIQNYDSEKGSVQVQNIKHEVKKELHKIQLKSKNIESQIFTFNQNLESLSNKQSKLAQHIQDLQKTVKIRKSSQKILFIPTMDFNPMSHNNLKGGQTHPKCVTIRQFIRGQEQSIDRKGSGEIIYVNQPKQNQILKERMKDYEQKLNTLNLTVRQMKQQLTIMNKKDKNRKTDTKKLVQRPQRGRSHTLNNINQTSYEQISYMAEKLSTSRLQIKKLLNDVSDLRHSYHVQEQNQQQDLQDTAQILNGQVISQGKQSDYEQQLKALINSQQLQAEDVVTDSKVGQERAKCSLEGLKQTQDMICVVEDGTNELSRSININSPNTYDQESSLGRQSPPPVDNPFRQYGNFRIEYVFGQQQNPNNQQQKANQHLGHIQVHPEPIVQPYRIVKSPIKKQHLFHPLVKLRQPFRYSCLAIPKQQNAQFQYIAIPENMYDPTEYDSVDTFQMELGKQYQMPKIVSKFAFRHTLLPSTFEGKFRLTLGSAKSKQKQNSPARSVKKQQRKNRIFESAGHSTFMEVIGPIISKECQHCLRDNLSQNKQNKKLPRIPLIIRQAPEANHQISMQIQRQSLVKSGKNIVKNQYLGKVKQSQIHQINQGSKQQVVKRIVQTKQKQQTELSKTSKDIQLLSNNDLSEDKKQERLPKKEFFKFPIQRKQKISKQKFNAILNKSKQIISKYKSIQLKRQ